MLIIWNPFKIFFFNSSKLFFEILLILKLLLKRFCCLKSVTIENLIIPGYGEHGHVDDSDGELVFVFVYGYALNHTTRV